MDMHFEGVVFQTHAAELARRLAYPHPPFAILDVRSARAFARERVPGSKLFDVNGPITGLPLGTNESTEFFIIGAGPEDGLVRLATHVLKSLGARRIVEMVGGLREWKGQGLPIERGERQAA